LCPGQKSVEVIFMLREQLIQSLPRLVHLTQGELAAPASHSHRRPPCPDRATPLWSPLTGGDYGG
jgi:hypothetical protein